MEKYPKLRAVAALFVFLILILGVRSYLLPAKTALVFLEYSGDANWVPAPESALFDDGVVDWAAYEPVQLAGQDLGLWHEVALVSFDNKENFESFQHSIGNEAQLARYHLIDVEPWWPEFLSFVNWNIRRNADESVEIGTRVTVEEAIPSPDYAQQWRDLFNSPYRDEIVMFNFHTYLDEPVSIPADDATDMDGYERYGEKAKKVLGKLGGRIGRSGDISEVAVGPNIRKYDGYTFVHYPTVDAFEQMFTAKDRIDARVYQEAALSPTASAGYWGKPYKQFRFKNKSSTKPH